MAYTLLDAAYAMYYPEAEFAALGGKKSSLLRRAKATALRGARMAKRGARAVGRGARRAGGFAMRNKGKLALGAGGLATLGLGAYGLSRMSKKSSEPAPAVGSTVKQAARTPTGKRSQGGRQTPRGSRGTR